MAKDVKTGTKPSGNFKFVDGPDINYPRDNSGGPDDAGNFCDCHAEFGDGGKVAGGDKPYLTQKGGVPC